MFDIIASTVALALGLYMAIRPRASARMTVKFYERIHVFHPPEQVFRVLFLILGIAFCIIGFLGLIQIIKFG